jgi:hypothetical protein
MVSGVWGVKDGVRCVECEGWCQVCGVRRMVSGVWGAKDGVRWRIDGLCDVTHCSCCSLIIRRTDG